MFLATCCLLATSYLGLAAPRFLAAWYAQRLDRISLEKAIRLDSGNAEYHYTLGRYDMLVAQEPASAVRSFQAALLLNPNDARYWLALANAYHVLSDVQAQGSALERAIQVDPRTPRTAWQVANFYWARGEDARALPELSVVLQNDAELTPDALENAWKLRPDTDFLLQHIVPRNVKVYSSFLALMISRHEASAAAQVWDQLIRLEQPFEPRFVFQYVRLLLDLGQIQSASQAWHDAAPLSGLTLYQPSTQNLVVNGDFSLPILNGGFDWVYEHSPEVTLALDPAETHFGQQSLSLDFDSRGLDDVGISQLIPVTPNSRYQFSCYFKTEDLRGAGGPRFVLQDQFHRTLYFQSEEMKDTPFWKLLSGGFTTGPDTTLLLLRIERYPPGDAIRGKLWIDGVSLAPQPGNAL